jgi:arginyl-tRNA synthetase
MAGGETDISYRSDTVVSDLLSEIITQGVSYGRGDGMRGRRVLVEFVSANPNGPLTIGHGRGGALGDALAGAARFAGADARSEFYVNDATNSRQMTRFAQAVNARLSAKSDSGYLDDGGYPEEYVARVAEAVASRLAQSAGAQDLRATLMASAAFVREEQEAVLRQFGLHFDNWFSEADLHGKGVVAHTVRRLRDSGFAFEQGGALWLRSTAFGDEDDRTLVRADGTPTYLAGDLAYHADKFTRGYDILIDVWSADHAGYVGRTRAGLAALGYDPTRLKVVLHGSVRFIRDGAEVRGDLSGAGGVSLEDALEDIPASTVRLMFLRAPAEAPIDLDANLARRADRSNPAWRIQEALRLCAKAKIAEGTGASSDTITDSLAVFPELVRRAAESLWPHHITDWALDLSDRILILAATGGLSSKSAHAAQIALTNALDLLGVSRENDTDV